MKKIISSICLVFLFSSCGQEVGGGEEGSDGVAANDHRIFVSSTSFIGSAIGGVVGGDAECTSLAKAAGLVRTYKSILSDLSTNATRLIFTGGVYTVPTTGNAILVAATGSDLWDTDSKNLLSNIGIDENGSTTSSYVWTGTDSDGATMISEHCNNWASSAGNGGRGHTDQFDARWVEDTGASCSVAYPIYCISQ